MRKPNSDNLEGEGLHSAEWQALIELVYKDRPTAKSILLEHSQAVADYALQINEKKGLGLDGEMVRAAAMLHDIGIITVNAPGIGCVGSEDYIRHGVNGAQILRGHGFPEWAARVAERHTGIGLTAEEIIKGNLPLPVDVDMMPQSMLEKLICYADKFYSKRPGYLKVRKSHDKVRNELMRHGEDVVRRFDELHSLFGED